MEPPLQPASVSRTRATSSSGVTRSLPGGSSQSRRQTPSGSGRPVTSPAEGPDTRHGGVRWSNAWSGHGSSVRRAATACRSTAVRPGKRMSRSLRTVERGPSQPTRWLPRHQVPWGPRVWAVTPEGSCSMPSRRLSTAIFTSRWLTRAARRTPVSTCWAMCRGAGSVVSSNLTSRVTCLRRIDRHPAQWTPAPSRDVAVSRSIRAAVSSRRTTVRASRGSSLPGPSSRTTDGTCWRASARASVSPTGPAPTMITGSTACRPLPTTVSSGT